MFSIIGKVLGLLKSNGGQIIGDVARNRLLNKHTPKGLLLAISSLTALGYIDTDKANLLVTLVSGSNISWSDIYVALVNITFIYTAYRGLKLIYRASDCLFEQKILKKYNLEGKENVKDIGDAKNKEE